MPFSDISKRISALFAFVDQFSAGENAMRSHFDQVVGDLVVSVNELAAYLETTAASGADQRYLGRVIAVPTERLDASPLEEGDFYVANHADAGRVGLIYVYSGSAFVVCSDFATIGTWFKDTLSQAANAAAGRVALGLGTAATQNSTAFAAASVATDVALAIKLLASGIAKDMTGNDWNNAHLAGPGTTMVAANAAATNAPVALNASGVYVAYDANNGFLIAAAHGSETLYYRIRAADAWGNWHRMPQRDTVISSLSINTTLSDTPGADLIRIGASVTDLPSGVAEGDTLLSSVYSANEAGQLIMTRAKRIYLRGRTGGVTSSWQELRQEIVLDEKTAAASATLDFVTGWDENRFRYYDFEIENLKTTNDASNIWLYVSPDGVAFDLAASDYSSSGFGRDTGSNNHDHNDATASLLRMHPLNFLGNAATEFGISGKFRLFNAGSNTAYCRAVGQITVDRDTGASLSYHFAGRRNALQKTLGLRFAVVGGNSIASGRVRMIGVP